MKRWMNGVRRVALAAPCVLLAVPLLGGCGPSVTDPHAIERILVPPIVRQMPLDTLLAAPETLAVDGRSIDVEAYAGWDMSPMVGPHRRRGLIAVVRMREPDQPEFQSGVEALGGA